MKKFILTVLTLVFVINFSYAKYIPENSNMIRVEIEVLDDTSQDFYNIIEVQFANKNIELLNATLEGQRARTYFQLPPGKYELRWKVSLSKYAWPRSKSYKQIIELKKDAKFVHILIQGEKVTIS